MRKKKIRYQKVYLKVVLKKKLKKKKSVLNL